MKEIPYHLDYLDIPFLIGLYFNTQLITRTYLVLELLSIYIYYLPFPKYFVYLHYLFFVLQFPFIFQYDSIAIAVFALLLYSKRNWIAVMKLKFKFYPIILVLLSSLYTNQYIFCPLIFGILLSIVSFQIVGIKWKKEYVTGVLFWINSFAKQETGIIV